MDIPETQYATTVDDVHIGYQVFGDGPVDLVYVQGYISNVDAHWDVPPLAGFLRRLARLARVVTFDRRGSGVSDKPAADTLGLEIGVEDIVAVMDAVGSERALLWGFEDGGALGGVFAATHPERTLGLVLFATWVRFAASDDYPWGWTEEDDREWRENVEGTWGSVAFWRWNLSKMLPDLADDDATAELWARYSRLCASPGSMALIDEMNAEIDIRAVLPSIQAPTLLMHRVDDQFEPIEASRYMVSMIPGSRLVELPGNEHPPFFGDVDAVTRELSTFIGEIHTREAELDRVLATILFTDIVDSTARASAVGDVRWTETRIRHDQLIRAQIARYRGREIKTMGDGFLATFDGPARGVRCAEAIAAGVRPLGIEIRAGLHTGEVSLEGDDVAGVGVAIGARVGALAGPSEVLVSQTVKDLVAGSGLTFEDAGEHELKGIPERWRLYRVAAVTT